MTTMRRSASRLLAAATCVSLLAGCADGAGRTIVAGDVAVLVSAPADAGMDALGGGTVEVLGGCLGAGGAVIVWPHGTKVVGEDPLTVELPGYGTYAVGDDVEVAGGYVLEHSTGDVEPGPLEVGGVTVPATCAEHDVFLAH